MDSAQRDAFCTVCSLFRGTQCPLAILSLPSGSGLLPIAGVVWVLRRAAAVRVDAMGGNCITTVIGTLRQGDYEASSVTLKCAVTARHVRNFPIINNNRCGLYASAILTAVSPLFPVG